MLARLELGEEGASGKGMAEEDAGIFYAGRAPKWMITGGVLLVPVVRKTLLSREKWIMLRGRGGKRKTEDAYRKKKTLEQFNWDGRGK